MTPPPPSLGLGLSLARPLAGTGGGLQFSALAYAADAGVECSFEMPADALAAGCGPVHPFILHFPAGWQGKKWWGVYSPYKSAGAEFENPVIVCSDDGIDFVYPDGITNPIQPSPEGSPYNADPTLYYDAPAGLLYCFWLEVAAEVTVKYRTSANGVAWSDVAVAMPDGESLGSPSFHRTPDGSWICWGAKGGNPNEIRMATAAELGGPWSAQTATVAPQKLDFYWHREVRKVAGKFYLLESAMATGNYDSSGTPQALTLMESEDGLGFSYTVPMIIGWDGVAKSNAAVGFYKSSFVHGNFGNGVIGKLYHAPATWGQVRVSDLKLSHPSELGTDYLDRAVAGAIADPKTDPFLIADNFDRADGNVVGSTTPSGHVWLDRAGAQTPLISNKRLIRNPAGASSALVQTGSRDGIVGCRMTAWASNAGFQLWARENGGSGPQRVEVSTISNLWYVGVYHSAAWEYLGYFYVPRFATSPYDYTGIDISLGVVGRVVTVWANGRVVFSGAMSEAADSALGTSDKFGIGAIATGAAMSRFFAHPL